MLYIDFSTPPNLNELLPKLQAVLGQEEANIFRETFDFYYTLNPDFLKVTTSGSTGTPKTFTFSRRAVSTSIEGTAKALNLGEGITAALALPLRYIAGRMMLLRAMHFKWKLLWNKPTLRLPDLPDIDFAALTPAQVSESTHVLDSIQTLLLGGSAISDAMLSTIRQKAKHAVYQSFAATETLSNFALRQLAPEYQEFYTTLPGVHIRVDEQSRLWIHYPGITADFITTGDVVNLQSPTSFVWRGRADFVINSGGVKVHPEFLEAQLSEALPDKRFIITSVPDERLGEAVAMVIESPMALDSDDLKSTLEKIASKKGLLKHLLPRVYTTVPQLPVTPTGKLDRIKIKEWTQETFSKQL
ncbi:O-succinylbenzoic acid--CoA ligase [Thermaurantimonas aggregans]|uniref:O-succinylbenzoic acid--CoA ligase n=1 Tax=Thermaurantimonas aggregans TaxID=2173829 RepID=A0A401XL58_9FLAO|nr:AMP-binding protein [Thermaurantimonas aggregans]MCX8149707.1 AMP-binding protein [Thermaurantimonas aggregans]GCD77724.1 O-succinylbenzoic acid--CoA ligase [Thermaurantimonas aggregans]